MQHNSKHIQHPIPSRNDDENFLISLEESSNEITSDSTKIIYFETQIDPFNKPQNIENNHHELLKIDNSLSETVMKVNDIIDYDSKFMSRLNQKSIQSEKETIELNIPNIINKENILNKQINYINNKDDSLSIITLESINESSFEIINEFQEKSTSNKTQAIINTNIIQNRDIFNERQKSELVYIPAEQNFENLKTDEKKYDFDIQDNFSNSIYNLNKSKQFDTTQNSQSIYLDSDLDANYHMKLHKYQSQLHFLSRIFQFKSIPTHRNFDHDSFQFGEGSSKRFQFESKHWIRMINFISDRRDRLKSSRWRSFILNFIQKLDKSPLTLLHIISNCLKFLFRIPTKNYSLNMNKMKKFKNIKDYRYLKEDKEEYNQSIHNKKKSHDNLIVHSFHTYHSLPLKHSSVLPRDFSNLCKFILFPLTLHGTLTFVQILVSIYLSQKSAKLTRSLVDHQFRAFTATVLSSSILSIFAALIASTKKSLYYRMKTLYFLHLLQDPPLDTIHYDLLKTMARSVFDISTTSIDGILELIFFSFALGRLSGTMAPIILGAYTFLQKFLFVLLKPTYQYSKLYESMDKIVLSLSEKLWNDENTDFSFYENLLPGNQRNIMERFLKLFSNYCSIQLKISKLNTLYRQIFGVYLQKKLPFIISWTYTAILVIFGNLRYVTHAELASLFRYMSALVSHQILASYKVTSIFSKIHSFQKLRKGIKQWESNFKWKIEEQPIESELDVSFNNLSLSSISDQVMTPSKNHVTMINAIQCANVGPVPNLQSSLAFTPFSKDIQYLPQLTEDALSLSSNIHRSAEWVINYCIRTDMNLLVTCQNSPTYESLYHKIIWIAQNEGILCESVHSQILLPETSLRSFFRQSREQLGSEEITDTSIDRILTKMGLTDVIAMSNYDFNTPFSRWKAPNFSLKYIQMLHLSRILFLKPVFCVIEMGSINSLSKKDWSLVKQCFSSNNILIVRFSRYLTDDLFTSSPSVVVKNQSNLRDTMWQWMSLNKSTGSLLNEELQAQENATSQYINRVRSLHTDVATVTTIVELDEEMLKE